MVSRSGQKPDWLFVARDNNYGLTRDVELLMRAIVKAGGRADFATIRDRSLVDWMMRRQAAQNIVHIERVFPRWLSAGAKNWLIPNQERFPRRHSGRLRKIDRVLAKTLHAQQIFSDIGVPTSHIGFTSEDRQDVTVEKDWNSFLHVAGGSTLKGTEDILALWRAHPEWPQLVLVQKAANAPRSVPHNVTLYSGHIDDRELKHLQNACGIHLCPSRAEGWGHHIVEAMSVGAVVVTTDGPPMNEHIDATCGVLVAVERSERRHLGQNFFVDRKALETAIVGLLTMDNAAKWTIGSQARHCYERIGESFSQNISNQLGLGAQAPHEARQRSPAISNS